MKQKTVKDGVGITWEISVPLINNRLIVGATIKIFGFAGIGVGALLGLVFALQGNFHLIPQILLMMTLLGGGAIIVSLFLICDPFKVPLWMPMVLLCFALATVWMISLFGYVILGCIVLVAAAVLINAFSLRQSYLHPGISHPRWHAYSGDDWALLMIAAAGLGVLGYFALRAIRGRFRSVLDSDMSDMGA